MQNCDIISQVHDWGEEGKRGRGRFPLGLIQKHRISSFLSAEKFVNQPGFFALAFDPPIKNRSPLASFLSPPGFFNVGYGCAPLAPPEPRCLRRRRRRKRREDGEDFPPLLVSTSVKTKKREKRKEEEEETEEKG